MFQCTTSLNLVAEAFARHAETSYLMVSETCDGSLQAIVHSQVGVPQRRRAMPSDLAAVLPISFRACSIGDKSQYALCICGLHYHVSARTLHFGHCLQSVHACVQAGRDPGL